MIPNLAIVLLSALSLVLSSTHDNTAKAQLRLNIAVVYSWHVGKAGSDVRWGDYEVGGGDGAMFASSVRSVKETHPDLPIFLFTNGNVSREEVKRDVTVVEVINQLLTHSVHLPQLSG
jgi:hypothetical protein